MPTNQSQPPRAQSHRDQSPLSQSPLAQAPLPQATLAQAPGQSPAGSKASPKTSPKASAHFSGQSALSLAEPVKPGPGFNDYPMDSQAVFRLALAAMSKPAQAIPFDFGALFKTAPPLPPTVAALALTLADHLTPIWLSPSLAGAESFLVFHCSAPLVQEPEPAALLLVASQSELPPLSRLSQGDPRYPDRSATVILADVLDAPATGSGLSASGPGLPLLASGPGLAEEISFEGHGLTEVFIDQWTLNRSSYPLGLDVFLAGKASLVGLPRSLSLRPKEAYALSGHTDDSRSTGGRSE